MNACMNGGWYRLGMHKCHLAVHSCEAIAMNSHANTERSHFPVKSNETFEDVIGMESKAKSSGKNRMYRMILGVDVSSRYP